MLAVQQKDIPQTGSISDLVNCDLKLFISYVDRELCGPPICAICKRLEFEACRNVATAPNRSEFADASRILA